MSKRVVVICGVSGRGKSTSLINMDNTLHLICEEGKDLPFSLKGKKFFKSAPVTTPQQVLDTIAWAEDKTDYNTIVIDGLNYLMDMYESQFVFGSADSRGEWGGYQQFFKDLVHAIAVSSKDFIICAHVAYKYNEQDMVMDARIPVKGALAKAGLDLVSGDYYTITFDGKGSFLQIFEEWLRLMRWSHRYAPGSSCSIPFMPDEHWEEWVLYLLMIRRLQDFTQGFRYFYSRFICKSLPARLYSNLVDKIKAKFSYSYFTV